LLHAPGTVTVTVFESLAVPLGPVQLNVNVVLVVIALLVVLPLVGCEPDQPPEAVHDVTFALVHESCVVAPLGTLIGVAVRLTVGVGAAVTVTVFESLAVPPGPVQVSVNVVLVVSALLAAPPFVACEPDHPPDAVHDVAFALVQDRFVVEPLATLIGFAVRLTVGAGGAPPETIATWSKVAVLMEPALCEVTASPI
jgi:hypothetical protein